jgi:hypothetical protein
VPEVPDIPEVPEVPLEPDVPVPPPPSIVTKIAVPEPVDSTCTPLPVK